MLALGILKLGGLSHQGESEEGPYGGPLDIPPEWPRTRTQSYRAKLVAHARMWRVLHMRDSLKMGFAEL